MKENLIEIIRSVPITDKTYAEYVEAVADVLLANEYSQAPIVERNVKKQRKELQKYINLEVIEVLTSICMYLEKDGRLTGNPSTMAMRMHVGTLNDFSNILRKEIQSEEGK